MANKFKFSISTPTGHKLEIDGVEIITADLLEGRIGVMKEHTPLVSSLKIANFKVKTLDGVEFNGAVKGGIFDVRKDEVIILTPNFCMDDEVNVQHAEDEIKNVEYQLQADVKDAEQKILGDRLKYAQLKLDMA